MPLTSISQIPVGSTLQFRSKNPSDLVVWEGVLESIGSYRSIQSIQKNTQAYNQAVRQNDNSVPADVTLLTYFTITVNNNSTAPTIMAFADQWIAPGSLTQVSLGTEVTVVVTDPNNNPNQIQSLLASAGYASRIVS